MKTEKIVVSSNGRGMTMALDEVEAFSRSMGVDERSSMRARLLAEETMSMVRAIVEDFEADFWMESTEECSCELHLLAVADMNFKKRQDLINTSTHKRNPRSYRRREFLMPSSKRLRKWPGIVPLPSLSLCWPPRLLCSRA